jgi:DNA-binding response OmpR family regulator
MTRRVLLVEDDREVAEHVRRGLEEEHYSVTVCYDGTAGRVVTRDHLMNTVWGDRELCNNNLDVFIRFLRTKVDLPGHPKLIQTERGIGYKLVESKC